MGIASVEALCNLALGYAGVRTRINSIDERSVAAEQCKNFYAAFRDELLNDHWWPFAGRYADLTLVTGNPWDSTFTYAAGALATFGSMVYRSIQNANTGNEPPTNKAWWTQVSGDEWAYVYELPNDVIDLRYIIPKQNKQQRTSPTSYAVLRTPRSDQRIPYDVVDANDGTGRQYLFTDCQDAVLFYTAQITNPLSFSGPFTKALAWKLAPALCMALRADVTVAERLEKKAEVEKRESIATEMRGLQEDAEPPSEFEAARER